jgi:hypothetical protein
MLGNEAIRIQATVCATTANVSLYEALVVLVQ